MSLVKVPVAGTIGKAVRINPAATVGATVGTNLFDSDGNLVDLDALLAAATSEPFDALTKAIADTLYVTGNVLQYGAKGDDATDNAGAFQAAIDAAQGQGGRLHIPAGTYRIGSTLTATDGLIITGDGRLKTVIKKTFAAGHLFDIASDDPVIARDFSITSTITQTSGAYFFIDGGSGSTLNKYSRFVNLRLGAFYDGIWFEDAAGYAVEDCYFVETSHVAIQAGAAAPQEVDNGDGQISGCIFDTSDNTGTYAVRQYAGGGLRITNNKFLNHEFQYSCEMGAGLTTSILIINGNSFENPGDTNISIDEISTGSFGQVVITSNQITANGTGYGMNIRDINNLTIGDNTIQCGASLTAAILLQSVSEFMISPNTIDGNAAATGISIDSGCANGNVAVQTLTNLSTTISNSSSTTIVERRMLVGTATWDPANMNDGESQETDITVTGAGSNDPAIVNFPGLGSNAVIIGGQVRAADTVHATMVNHSGGALNPSSSTVTAIVFKAQ